MCAQLALYAADNGTYIEVYYTVYTPSRSEKKSTVLGTKITDNDYTKDLFTDPYSCKELKIHDHGLINPPVVNAHFLIKLDLSHGTLQQFDICNHLAGMPSLISLDLSHNELTLINAPKEEKNSEQEGLFKHLESLNISHNQLQELDFNLLNRLKGLKVIDYSHNHITQITGVPTQPKLSGFSRFDERTQLTQVILTGNKEFNGDEKNLSQYTHDFSQHYHKWLLGGMNISALLAGLAGYLGTAVPMTAYTANHISPVPYGQDASGEIAKLVGIPIASGAAGGLITGSIGVLIGYLGARCMYRGQKYTQIFDFVFEHEKQSDTNVISINDSDAADGSDEDSQ